MRDLVEAFFEETSIVDHHMSSYDDFIPTRDNPNSRAQKIVDNIRIGFEEEGWGKIKLDPEKVDGQDIQIRVGRERLENGQIDPNAEPTIRMKRPSVKEASGSEHKQTPQEARLRDLYYDSELQMKFTVIREGMEEEPQWITIGRMPAMIGSKICNINPDNIGSTMEEILNMDIESEEYLDMDYHDKLIPCEAERADPVVDSFC